MRSADNVRGKHDATIASTGNGSRWPWAPIRTFRSRRRERVTRQPHAYSPQTWTRPRIDKRCDSADAFAETVGAKKRGTPATGQPVREFESRPLPRIECDCPVLDPLRTVVTVRIRRIKKASHSRTLALGCGSGINPLQNNTCGRSTVTVWIRYRNVSRSMVASYES